MIDISNQRLPIEPPIQNATVSQNKAYCGIAVAGISLGLITGLALGIIFGPLAALVGFAAGATGVLLGSIIHSCLISKDNRQGIPVDSPPDPVGRAPANWNDLTDEQKAANLDERHIARKAAHLALQAKIANLRNDQIQRQ